MGDEMFKAMWLLAEQGLKAEEDRDAAVKKLVAAEADLATLRAAAAELIALCLDDADDWAEPYRTKLHALAALLPAPSDKPT